MSTPKTRTRSEPSHTTQRHISMLRVIPREPLFSTTMDIFRALQKEGYEVTKRSVERSLVLLEPQYGYICEVHGRTHRWYWRRDKKLDVPGIDPASALVMSMAYQQLHGQLPPSALELLQPYFDTAERTLQSQPGNTLAAWRKKVRVITRGPQLLPPQLDSAVQRAVYDAILHGRQIKAMYRKRGATDAKETILHPIALVVKEGVIYVVATAWDYLDPYHYALHRFDRAELLGETARRSDGFDLDKYIVEQEAFSYPLGHSRIKVRLELEEHVAEHLAERPIATDQKFGPVTKGRSMVTATVTDSEELRWWILSFGPGIRVRGPKKLQDSIAQTARAVARMYNRP